MKKLVLLLVIPFVVTLTACGTSGTGDKGYVSGNGIISRVPAADREAVTGDVGGKTLEGESWSLKEQRGKVVVLNVWGSWCPPCRKEAPVLEEAAHQLQPKGVVFMGINTRDSSTAQGLAFQREFKVTYQSLFDPDGQTLLRFRGTITPNAIPSTLVIDADGKVAASVLGELTSPRTLIGLVEDVQGGAKVNGSD